MITDNKVLNCNILIRLPSQCKVRKWWSITIDQDEWFNLYLYLGSCWVKSRYELDTILDTRPDTSPDLNQRKSRSIDRTENITELKGVLTQKVELKSRVWGQGLLLTSSKITYWRRISSWTISSSSTRSTRNQDQL